MNRFGTSGRSSPFFIRKDHTITVFKRLFIFLLMISFIIAMPAQHVQAVVTSREVDASEKNRTTMYVSSALTARHGLCVLLENVDASGNKKFGMIDTGNSNASAAKAFLNKHGVKTLEFLILTHMHKDHTGNAVWFLKNCKVKKLYLKQFDATWSDGEQSVYENILRTALTSPYTTEIHGVGYGLSMNKTASPKASKGFISFLKSHANVKHRFKGLFTSSNTALYLGQTSLRLFNWEIWTENGTSLWVPGKNTRCKVQKYATDRSDNHFSLGVRITRGSHKIWVGGDMTNLRMIKNRHVSYKGDEERLARNIGKVDVAVLNHHGRGGSNVKSFLKVLSPSYVIYTSTKSEIMASGSSLSASIWNYIRYSLRVPSERIFWAYDYWGTHHEDVAITLYANSNTAAKASASSANTAADANKALVVPLVPGKTYTNYDVTGDGKNDVISVTSTKSGDTYKGLTVSINKKAAWGTRVSFKDTRPVTLVRLPGKKPYLCISILSPVGAVKGRALGLYQYGKKSGSQYGLIETYSFLKKMPISQFAYRGTPSISCTAKRITLVAEGSDTLSANAYVTFALEMGKNGLDTISTVLPYTSVKGKSGTVTLKQNIALFASPDAAQKSSSLAKGQTVTVTHVYKNKTGSTRYRIIDANKKVWWIPAPAAAK